ncbi:thioredoxin [Rhodococcus sp. RS1C4]|uniref:thioredoxin family protein n=1 Tax=Rhodococcoides fascians TaxID=1828 RepID=UPI00055E560B|nr:MULTISPECIES: thioredoxin family protein [Rhodococcus]OZC57792.1 thioredoxin [Rhodococcus sp. RS1C4]
MTGITILVVTLVVATVVGLVLRHRSGRVQVTESHGSIDRRALLLDAGAVPGAATVLHFSAEWCGPCAAVRRVVDQVIGGSTDGGTPPSGPRELEVDIDAHPMLAKEMGVLSLPTTFVLDAELVERARISGVPKADALRSALENL